MKTCLKFITLTCMLFCMVSCANDDLLTPNDETQSDSSMTNPHEVTVEEARAKLLSLLTDLDGFGSRSSGRHLRNIESSFTASLSRQMSRSDDTLSIDIHIFNFANDEGYAMMSGDDRLPSLLAITDRGSINDGDVIDNPGVGIFLEGLGPNFNDVDTVIIDDPNFGKYETYGNEYTIVYSEGGTCPVQWNQGTPYNYFCPKIDDRNAPTGCVATAVAQLMARYQYPESYEGYEFNWEDMTANKHYYIINTPGAVDVAHLMAALGEKKNLNMDYGKSESGAPSVNILRTLYNFNYSSCGQYKPYNQSDVLNDLKYGYPVLLAGTKYIFIYQLVDGRFVPKINKKEAHQWLAHGLIERRQEVFVHRKDGTLINRYLRSFWYLLCNWGWGGKDDGYYLSGAFNPKKKPVYPTETTSRADLNKDEFDNGFVEDITMVWNIRP